VGPFDLVVSGINRGNNYGLHVIYSGTVAGAREAAAKGVPAVALSLDTHAPDADYAPAAAAALPLLRRLLARLARGEASFALRGCVLNVNFPCGQLLRGYALTRQGYECTLPGFLEAAVPPDAAAQPGVAGALRAWRNSPAGGTRLDRTPGTDSAAVAAGQIAVTVITLLSHAPPLGSEPLVAAAAPPLSQAPQLEGVCDEAADAVLDAALAAAAAAGGGAAMAARLAAAPAEA
jgi:5'-nucleotidase